MSTVYPGAIDSFTNPTGTDTLDSPSHSQQHSDVNDAIEAIETALGANLIELPLGVLDLAERTSDQGTITTETDLTSLTVTLTPKANRRIRVSGYIRWESSDADGRAILRLKQDGTTIQTASGLTPLASGVGQSTLFISKVLTPTAASHTYKLTLAPSGAAASVAHRASSDSPGYILVEDIGPV